jgi:hypothetical protein
MELAITGGTRRLRPALYPESPSAALAALGTIAADIEDVLPRTGGFASSGMALQGTISFAGRPLIGHVGSCRGCRQGGRDRRKHERREPGEPLWCATLHPCKCRHDRGTGTVARATSNRAELAAYGNARPTSAAFSREAPGPVGAAYNERYGAVVRRPPECSFMAGRDCRVRSR